MAYNKRFSNKRKNKTTDDIEFKTFEGSIPSKPVESPEAMMFNVKAFRDLQNVGSIEVKADPNASITRGSYPYNIIARTNSVIDANYSGYDNIEGNILTRLQNSNSSKLLNNFDITRLDVTLNYLYANYSKDNVNNHNNLAYNVELAKAFNEALSKAYSTMLTQLPYSSSKVTTDIPVPNTLSEGEQDIYHKLGGILHYQCVLQNAMAPIAKYIETMQLEQTMLDVSYRRESPTLTALYSLLKKKAFIGTLNAIGTNIIGEYFDDNWYRQMNTIINVPSRKSNSMTDPLMTCVAVTHIPSCKIENDLAGATSYDSSTLVTSAISLVNPETLKFDLDTDGKTKVTKSYTLQELTHNLVRLLDVYYMTKWARLINNSPTSTDLSTPTMYFNQIAYLIENINLLMTRFVTAMVDIRTFIDKLASSGLVYWKKGARLTVDGVKPASPTYNVILHNIMSAYTGGSQTMTFDTNTQRWQAYTLWNKYTGIAQFDSKSGGAFLTFALRKLIVGDLKSTDSAMCLPILFKNPVSYTDQVPVKAASRLGFEITIGSEGGSSALDNPVLSRLNPLNTDYDVKVPYVDLSSMSGTDRDKKAACSAVEHFLLNLFGYGSIKLLLSTGSQVISSCNPDYICFLDVQIEDVTNEMIQYARNYSPFRVMTPNGKRTMGFGK